MQYKSLSVKWQIFYHSIKAITFQNLQHVKIMTDTVPLAITILKIIIIKYDKRYIICKKKKAC